MNDSENTSTKVITVRLRIPALVLMAVILVGALVWAFVLGIMVGRGQINEQLEALRPPAQNAEEKSVADKAADEIESLIKAEDLKYQESLRQNQTPAALADAARSDSAQSRPPAAKQTQQPAQASSGLKFSYLYQVASYVKEEQAKELQSKLLAKGVDAQVETKIIDGSSRFRVLISFQGDENSIKSMQDMLKKDFKINSILPRGKTPLDG